MSYRRLLLAGDSLIEFYDWQVRFADRVVWNYGRAGETVEGLLSRVPAIINQVRPDFILLMSGTNNIGMDDYAFIPNYRKVIECFSAAFPDADIFINSLMPIRLPWLSKSAVPRVNGLLAKLASEKGVGFLNIYEYFLNQNGSSHQDCFLGDGVHLSEFGYARWAEVLEGRIGTL
ncbi:MAG: GDSL family lipase [Proteobacteria bacterium]|nr:GDSL family lipase [Pseudomonadota bacterium]MBU1711326.1 GDSL family lipase [Pseudomonadota bacterium]